MSRRAMRCQSLLVTLAAVVAVTPIVAAWQKLVPIHRTYKPQGVKVKVSDGLGEDCFIYIAAWEIGSWYRRQDKVTGHPQPKETMGTPATTGDARRDIDEVKRWIELMIAQSPDMRRKARKACEATGVNFVQIGIVRDDPEAGPGAWYRGSPVIIVDMGDIEKLGQHTEASGGNASLQTTARLTVASLLPATLIAHELDHAMRAGELAPRYWKEVLAMEDENAVISELDAFEHAEYERTDYTDRKGSVPFTYKAASWPEPIVVKVNAAKALGRSGRGGHNHYVETDEEDHHALDEIPHATRTSNITSTVSPSVTLKASYTFSRAPTAPKVQTFAAFFTRVFGVSIPKGWLSGPTYFVSLGQTTGEAFEVISVDKGGKGDASAADQNRRWRTLALRPLLTVTREDVVRNLKAMDGASPITTRIDGYCLDHPKQPPPAGMVFVADDSLQAAVEPVDRIGEAVGQLHARGLLKPDQDDAAEYAHDMVQWSIWTYRERFDETRFTQAFVDHVRKNYQQAGDRWTRDVEQAVTALAPARWTVIQRVLADAAALEPW